MTTLGVIGGSGLYDMPGLVDVEHLAVRTPFGAPSDEFVRGRLDETRLVFLPRHGRGHRLLPSEINYRANILGMKQLGVECLVSVGSVGSLRREIEPGHLVVPNQFIDRTVARASTFFGDGIVAHVSLADPVCAALSHCLVAAARAAGGTVHEGGTYLCMEGPQFSTRAESELYRSWGASVIGMTNWQEAKLAREAELCFASLALCTDYDCWNVEAAHVLIEDVLRMVGENVALARRSVAEVARTVRSRGECGCARALQNGIITDPGMIPAQRKQDLALLIGRYVAE